jgi:hypothetical protein
MSDRMGYGTSYGSLDGPIFTNLRKNKSVVIEVELQQCSITDAMIGEVWHFNSAFDNHRDARKKAAELIKEKGYDDCFFFAACPNCVDVPFEWKNPNRHAGN